MSWTTLEAFHWGLDLDICPEYDYCATLSQLLFSQAPEILSIQGPNRVSS
jgi:hypothetical protein